jgi:hypothetical protein
MAEADQLASDYIQNFKTVATLSNEDRFVQDYLKLLKKPMNSLKRKIHLIGFVFGLSQFI